MRMNIVAAASLAALTLPAVHAAEFNAGDWTLSVGGLVNAFYTHSECKQPAGTVTGTALGDATLACGGKSGSTVIGNGLLPSMLNVGGKTRQGGYDIGANFGIGVSTATNSAIAQNNVVDVRIANVTVGNAGIGTFKLGRDYGLFGLHATLNDMTLMGVGAATQATQNGRVSLGHLGAGQIYPGTYGQMVYTSPAMGALSFDIGLMNPVNGPSSAKDSPQVQARATLTGQGYKAWVGVKNQRFDAPTAFTMNAAEIGGSVNLGAFGLVANYQDGKGLGILSDGDQGNVKTKAYFLQGTYKVADNLKFGLSGGKSTNDTGVGSGLRSNENVTAGVYYNLTKSFTLVGEVGQTKSNAFNGNTAKQNSVAFGGFFAF